MKLSKTIQTRALAWWRRNVRLAATLASSEVGVEIAVGEMLLPFVRNGWKMAPPTGTETEWKNRE